MRYIHLISTAAVTAIGYMNDTCETVTVTVAGGKSPVRVNKSDFDADQELPTGERQYKMYKGSNDPAIDTSGAVSDVNVTSQGEGGTILTTAAPSAPDFTSGDTKPVLMDEAKGAAAPTATDAGQWLVMKSGTGKNAKFFIANGLGQKITGDDAKLAGIDEAGYDTEDAARHVIDHTSR